MASSCMSRESPRREHSCRKSRLCVDARGFSSRRYGDLTIKAQFSHTPAHTVRAKLRREIAFLDCSKVFAAASHLAHVSEHTECAKLRGGVGETRQAIWKSIRVRNTFCTFAQIPNERSFARTAVFWRSGDLAREEHKLSAFRMRAGAGVLAGWPALGPATENVVFAHPRPTHVRSCGGLRLPGWPGAHPGGRTFRTSQMGDVARESF